MSTQRYILLHTQTLYPVVKLNHDPATGENVDDAITVRCGSPGEAALKILTDSGFTLEPCCGGELGDGSLYVCRECAEVEALEAEERNDDARHEALEDDERAHYEAHRPDESWVGDFNRSQRGAE
jgi:hypothetical protein